MTAVLNFSLEARPPAPAPRKRPCTDTQSEYSTLIYIASFNIPTDTCAWLLFHQYPVSLILTATYSEILVSECTVLKYNPNDKCLCILHRASRGRCIAQDLFERLASGDYKPQPQAQCALVNTWSRHVNFNHCQLLESRKCSKQAWFKRREVLTGIPQCHLLYCLLTSNWCISWRTKVY